MTTKSGSVVAYREERQPIKTHELLITWPCEVVLQIKRAISPPPIDQ